MAEAFRGLSSSSESEDEDGGFLRTYADERASKRRRMAAAVEAAQESGGGEYDAAAAAAADAAFEGVELPSDVEAALAVLRPRLPPRLVLAHHLPGVVERRGDCERELRDLAARRKVKYLQLPTAGSDSSRSSRPARPPGASSGSFSPPCRPLRATLTSSIGRL